MPARGKHTPALAKCQAKTGASAREKTFRENNPFPRFPQTGNAARSATSGDVAERG